MEERRVSRGVIRRRASKAEPEEIKGSAPAGAERGYVQSAEQAVQEQEAVPGTGVSAKTKKSGPAEASAAETKKEKPSAAAGKAGEPKTTSERRLAGEEYPRGGFVEHGGRLAAQVGVLERAAPHHRDAERFEVLWRD